MFVLPRPMPLQPTPVPTGLPAVDAAAGGGLPRGAITLLCATGELAAGLLCGARVTRTTAAAVDAGAVLGPTPAHVPRFCADTAGRALEMAAALAKRARLDLVLIHGLDDVPEGSGLYGPGPGAPFDAFAWLRALRASDTAWVIAAAAPRLPRALAPLRGYERARLQLERTDRAAVAARIECSAAGVRPAARTAVLRWGAVPILSADTHPAGENARPTRYGVAP